MDRAQGHGLSPRTRRAAVGLGVALGAVATKANPAPAAASPTRETSPAQGNPSLCPTNYPLDGREVARNNIVAPGSSLDLGEIILHYSPGFRCVRAIAVMDPALPQCRIRAKVYKPSTGQTNANTVGALGVAKVSTPWINDRNIQQKAIGIKTCGSGPPTALGGTAVY